MTRVLVVDDEPQLVRALTINLRARGYEVLPAATGGDALELAASGRPDVVLLDLGLPDLSGVEVVRALREWSRVPVVVLSARRDSSDKVAALDAGADDYVTKPFGMDELLARLRAAVRRALPGGPGEDVVHAVDFSVDLARHQVLRDGSPVRLTPTEWHLLAALARALGRLVSQRELLAEVWGEQYVRETNYLRLYVAQLRRKLEPNPSAPRNIVTEPGLGYRLEAARLTREPAS